MNFPDMTTKTMASRFRALVLVCALAVGALLAYLALSLPPPALTQATGITIADADAVDEGGDVEFEVTLNATTSAAINLNWTIAGGMGNPTDEDDFATTTGTVSIPASPTSGTTTTITVNTVNDDVVEPDESFTVTIMSDSLPSGLDITVPSADGTIANDDSAEISIADAEAVDEGTGAVFTVTLSKQVSQVVSLDWNVTGGMTNPAATGDFATTTGAVSFTALSTTTTFTVQTEQDLVVEPDESFTVTIATSTQALPGVTIDDDEATGTITNDDSAEIRIEDADAVRKEGGGRVHHHAEQAGLQAVNLSWTTTGGTA